MRTRIRTRLRFGAALIPIMICVFAATALGMGDMGGTPAKFPKPRKNFHAKIVDVKGEVSEAELVSCGGSTKITGYRGSTKIEVPFGRIHTVRIKDLDNRYKTAELTFWDETNYEIRVKSFGVCQGLTSLGEVTVKIKDIREVVFEKGEHSEFGTAAEHTPEP
ncbi:MAG: hypothetical protein KJ042_14175 [Deltaproteobacteria bacterium]|nr:hypothetical protein [Deltaproteobacteria bacterium]